MERSPAFLLYTSDWLASASVLALSLELQGAYMRLLCHAWDDSGISDPAASPEAMAGLGRLLGVSTRKAKAIWRGIQHLWVPGESGRLVNPRQEKVRADRMAKVGARVEASPPAASNASRCRAYRESLKGRRDTSTDMSTDTRDHVATMSPTMSRHVSGHVADHVADHVATRTDMRTDHVATRLARASESESGEAQGEEKAKISEGGGGGRSTSPLKGSGEPGSGSVLGSARYAPRYVHLTAEQLEALGPEVGEPQPILHHPDIRIRRRERERPCDFQLRRAHTEPHQVEVKA